jgi:DNA repair protein RadC
MNPDLFGYVAAEPRETAVSEWPRVRARELGLGALSDSELVTLQLQGVDDEPGAARAVAVKLVNHYGSLAALVGRTVGELMAVGGLSESQAWRLHASTETARRCMAATGEEQALNRADLVATFMQSRVAGLEVEKFWVLCLNRKNRLIRCCEVTSGTATAALAHPREVFRAAIRESATGIICCHNHPSGDPAPSAPDLHCTRQLREAARAVDVELIDHVIVGRVGADPTGKGYWSFRDAGLL